jgi:hypothetical protein
MKRSVVLINIWAFSCLYMGHFVSALNGSCSCPPMGRYLGPNPTRYIGPCWPGTKIFRVVSCLGCVFFSCFGPAHQAQPKCTPMGGGQGREVRRVRWARSGALFGGRASGTLYGRWKKRERKESERR